MIPELGHFALILSLPVAALVGVLALLGAHRNRAPWIALAKPGAQALALLVTVAYLCLTQAFIANDFSVIYVAQHSNSLLPLEYRIAAVWGGHEGSLLLWMLMLSWWALLVTWFSRNLPAPMLARVLGTLCLVAFGFLLFILLTSNPFERILPGVAEGKDLNPLLQDPGLIIHPPLLYMGYVGFSVAYAFAVAALLSGQLDAAWARWSRPWTVVAWIFLTLGIAMGSWWAYYELGWGGWWFWDPVENASLMPWLAGTALLHSAIVMEKRDALKIWTILLAILTFSLSLLGTFLVRSGVLTSVHAFASDPTRGVFILVILVAFVGGSLAIFAARANTLTKGGLFAPVSREGALVFNNLFLTAATAAVFIGTLYPLLLEATTGGKISVGAPFFEMTFGPLMVPLLLVVPIGPFLAWKRGDLLAVAQRLAVVFALAILAVLVIWWLKRGGPVLAPVGVGIAIWLMLGALAEIGFRIKLFAEPLGVSLRRAVGLPGSTWGTMLAHFGVGVMLLGIVAESAWKVESILVMKPGETVRVDRFDLTYEGPQQVRGPNFDETIARFAVVEDGRRILTLEPSKRIFRTRTMPTTETAIATRDLFSQLYLSVGDARDDGGVAMRIYWKPMVLLIWIGCLFMAIGGTVSLTDRRLRVGAPTPRKTAAAAIALPEAAE